MRLLERRMCFLVPRPASEEGCCMRRRSAPCRNSWITAGSCASVGGISYVVVQYARCRADTIRKVQNSRCRADTLRNARPRQESLWSCMCPHLFDCLLSSCVCVVRVCACVCCCVSWAVCVVWWCGWVGGGRWVCVVSYAVTSKSYHINGYHIISYHTISDQMKSDHIT